MLTLACSPSWPGSSGSAMSNRSGLVPPRSRSETPGSKRPSDRSIPPTSLVSSIPVRPRRDQPSGMWSRSETTAISRRAMAVNLHPYENGSVFGPSTRFELARGEEAFIQMEVRVSEDAGIELLVTKAGEGSLAIGDSALPRKDAKPLPSSD